jgi:hypothetical protein
MKRSPARACAAPLLAVLLAACCSTGRPEALLPAILAGDEAAAMAALEAGADPNFRDAEQCTVLMHAARRGIERVVRELLRKGADFDAAAADGRTALMEAAAACAQPVVELLLQAGARKTLRDAAGKTALDHANAATGTACEAVRALLR